MSTVVECPPVKPAMPEIRGQQNRWSRVMETNRTKTGSLLTDADIPELADEAECGPKP